MSVRPTPEADQERFLLRAIELARAARANGDDPYGSLLVGPDGTVLAESGNTVVTDNDITAHPELKLARWAAQHLDPATAAGTTMYTSCQACSMCSGAIDRSGLGRVVYALSAEQLGAAVPGALPNPVVQQGPALPGPGLAVVTGPG